MANKNMSDASAEGTMCAKILGHDAHFKQV